MTQVIYRQELEYLQQIVRALTDTLSKEERINLVFSALSEIDKIKKEQSVILSNSQLSEEESQIVTVLFEKITTTEKNEDPGIKAVRNILKQVMGNPSQFGLSEKMSMDAFLPDTKPFFTSQPVENVSEKLDEVLVLHKAWITRNLLPSHDLHEKVENAQPFVDALREGNYSIVSRFYSWIIEKYSDKKINPQLTNIEGDNLLIIIAYELAQIDIGDKDVTALIHMMDSSINSGDARYSATIIYSGIDTMDKRLSALQRLSPQKNKEEILQSMRSEYTEFLSTTNPIQSIIDNGTFDSEKDKVDLRSYQDKILIDDFAKKNRRAIAANLIVLNTKNANLEDINTLLVIKDAVIACINYLESNLSKSLKYENYLNKAQEILDTLKQGDGLNNLPYIERALETVMPIEAKIQNIYNSLREPLRTLCSKMPTDERLHQLFVNHQIEKLAQIDNADLSNSLTKKSYERTFAQWSEFLYQVTQEKDESLVKYSKRIEQESSIYKNNFNDFKTELTNSIAQNQRTEIALDALSKIKVLLEQTDWQVGMLGSRSKIQVNGINKQVPTHVFKMYQQCLQAEKSPEKALHALEEIQKISAQALKPKTDIFKSFRARHQSTLEVYKEIEEQSKQLGFKS